VTTCGGTPTASNNAPITDPSTKEATDPAMTTQSSVLDREIGLRLRRAMANAGIDGFSTDTDTRRIWKARMRKVAMAVKFDYPRTRLLRDADNDPATAARWCGVLLGWLSRWLLAVTRLVSWLVPALVRPVGRDALLVAEGVPMVRTLDEADAVLAQVPRNNGMAGWAAHRRVHLALYRELAALSWAQAFAVAQRVRLERQEVAGSSVSAANAERLTGQEDQESEGSES
jgi:hypothetical protein